MDYHLYKSNRKDKKYMVKFVNENGKINTIHFGAFGMSDYTINKDEKRKERYIKRHSKDYYYYDVLFESKKESKCPFRFFWNK